MADTLAHVRTRWSRDRTMTVGLNMVSACARLRVWNEEGEGLCDGEEEVYDPSRDRGGTFGPGLRWGRRSWDSENIPLSTSLFLRNQLPSRLNKGLDFTHCILTELSTCRSNICKGRPLLPAHLSRYAPRQLLAAIVAPSESSACPAED